jgi:hypothetical protein
MGMLDGYKRRPERPETDRLFAVSANTALAYLEYTNGYSAGLDSSPMPTYTVTPGWGARGGEARAMLNVIKSR